MPSVSRDTASETVATDGLEVQIEHLHGGYSVWLRVAHRRRRSRRFVPRPAGRPCPASPLGLRDQGKGRVPLPRPRGDLRGRRRLLRSPRPHSRVVAGRPRATSPRRSASRHSESAIPIRYDSRGQTEHAVVCPQPLFHMRVWAHENTSGPLARNGRWGLVSIPPRIECCQRLITVGSVRSADGRTQKRDVTAAVHHEPPRVRLGAVT
jgi:hypothetical protein